jgi:type II secretory pathway pseudopilin PulG
MSDEQPPQPAGRGAIGGMLAVLGVICILLALGIWGYVDRVKWRRQALETNAMGACRAYATAQAAYHRNDWDGDGKQEYASDLRELCMPKDFDGSGSWCPTIDDAFAAATSPQTPKHGYWFKDMATIGGKPINWATDFALCAMPARYGRTGYHVFIVSTNGTVWGKDLGKSEFVADFPADPVKAGWIIAE